MSSSAPEQTTREMTAENTKTTLGSQSTETTETTSATDTNQTSLGSILSGVKTPGIKNIEKAYSRAGASNHHTPGVATKLGSQDQDGAHQGVGSASFHDKISDQREEPTVLGKAFNNLINGTDYTK